MQVERIIEKAKQLGINVSSGNSLECLEEIAMQLGMDSFDPNTDASLLESALDSELAQNNSASLEGETFESPDYLGNDMPQSQGRFGEAEYNATRGENGAYDKNYYANRNKELDENVKKAEENKKNPQKEVADKTQGGANKFKDKNFLDKAKDNADLLKAKNARLQNRISDAKAKAFQVMHPGEALKNQAKQVAKNAAKNVTKKAGAAVGKAAVASGKAIVSFIASNPYVLVIIGGLALILLLILLLFGGNAGSTSGDTIGYYDNSCNFNDINVTLNKCNSTGSEVLSLDEYVIGATYAFMNNENYSNETIKALMIIMKTNALSDGNYRSSKGTIEIDDCDTGYTSSANMPSSAKNNLEKIYKNIEEEIYISTSYTSAITSLSPRNRLELNSDILTEMEELSDSLDYADILDKIYNTDVSDEDKTTEYRETIFIGDSRMTGMKNFGIVNDDNSVYAGAMGYYWFVGSATSTYADYTYNCKSNAINCVNEKVGNAPANIVSWLGVNDDSHYQKYFEKYLELAQGEWSHHNIYIVSVGYINNARYDYDRNASINTFNEYMETNINSSGLDNLIYLDLGFDEETMGNGTSDGIHYTKEFSQKVYDKIIEEVGDSSQINEKKGIYKLSRYCTYYTLTENDAYWWPIGSSEPTIGKNIYGGTPVSTTVTSPYGMRIHPVHGTRTMHNGVDIGAGGKTPVIAAKDGTVKSTSDVCVADGDGCNGGAGNMVVIDHGDGVVTRYLHLYPGSIIVKEGDKVKQGQKIAGVGTTGTSTGNHLHFEIIINGSTINPLDYISAEEPRPTNKVQLGNVEDNPESPAETKVAICNALLDAGFSKNAVAGMMVNIQAEGNFKLNNLENCYEENQCCFDGTYGFCMHPEIKGFGSDTLYTAGVDSGAYPREKFVNDHAGYGLIQWTASSRKATLYDYAKSQRKSIAALSVQLGELLEELKYPSYAETYKYVTGNYDAYDVANVFCQNFERPRNYTSSCPNRAQNNTPAMLEFVENGCSG